MERARHTNDRLLESCGTGSPALDAIDASAPSATLELQPLPAGGAVIVLESESGEQLTLSIPADGGELVVAQAAQ